jgi:hypothetical protein
MNVESNEEVATMADEEANDAEAQEEEEEERGGGQKIMCFVSKEMVPINETVEIEYMPGKKVRVLPKYIKYDRDAEPETAL